jgi:hypothetical protein
MVYSRTRPVQQCGDTTSLALTISLDTLAWKISGVAQAMLLLFHSRFTIGRRKSVINMRAGASLVRMARHPIQSKWIRKAPAGVE